MTHLVLDQSQKLRVARRLVHPVLDQQAQRPVPERRLSIRLDDVEMLPVRISSHLARLGDDGVDTLREGVLKYGQGVLQAGPW